jgi:GGDEF domain-containing protein
VGTDHRSLSFHGERQCISIARRGGSSTGGILLPGALAGRAARIAEALRRALDGAEGSPVERPVSASIGYGVSRSGATVSLAFTEADRGVYEVKALRSVGRH